MSNVDESYDDMADNYDCTGDGTTQATCNHNEQVDGVYTVYIACKDDHNNKNSVDDNLAVTYTINTEPVVPVEEDSYIPKIYNLTDSNVTNSSVIISWYTDILSDSALWYRVLNTGLDNLLNDPDKVLYHFPPGPDFDRTYE